MPIRHEQPVLLHVGNRHAMTFYAAKSLHPCLPLRGEGGSRKRAGRGVIKSRRKPHITEKSRSGLSPAGKMLYLINYASGVVSGSSTIVNTKVLGIAKKSPPRTVAVTMYLPGSVGIVLFAYILPTPVNQ